MNNNLFAALRSAFPKDLDAVAVETDDGLRYTWRDLERATAMLANLLQSLGLPAGARVAVQVEKSVEAMMFEKDIPQAFPVPGTPVWVQASIKKLPDGSIMRMKVDRIITLEEVRQQAVKSYTVNINMREGAESEQTARGLLPKLSQVASKDHGQARLRLELDYHDSRVILNAGSGVELTNEFIRLVQTSGLTGRYE